MADFYIKLQAEGDIEGPVAQSEVKRRALAGQLPRTAQISKDGVAWHTAGKVKGLFDAPAGVAKVARPAAATVGAARPASAKPVAKPRPAPPPPPPVSDDEPASLDDLVDLAPPPGSPTTIHVPAAQQEIGYYAPRTDVSAPIPTRSPLIYMIIAGLVVAAWAVAAVGSYVMEDMWTALGGVGVMLLLMLPALVLWLIWLYKAHTDIRTVTNGAYSISPGSAVGMSFIPLFDAYWIVYMPYRLAVETNRHLLSRGLKTIPAGAVMGCQIGSIVLAFFMPGLTPALYAVSMWLVQGGLNRLSKGA